MLGFAAYDRQFVHWSRGNVVSKSNPGWMNLASPILFGSNTDALISVLNLKFLLDINKLA